MIDTVRAEAVRQNMTRQYERDALDALKRAATAGDHNTERFELGQAITHVRLALGVTASDE